MHRKDYPKMSRSGYKQTRNEFNRDNCQENQRRIKRGKKMMIRRISNNVAVWKQEN